MQVFISDVRNCDIKSIEELERSCFSCPRRAEQLALQLKSNNHEFICAKNNSGDMLGYVGFMYVLDEGYIYNVAVAAKYRRHGVADSLICAIKQRANELDLSFLTLEVREGNAPARSLYSKHGFSDVGKRKGYYEHPKEDAVLMTHYLK